MNMENSKEKFSMSRITGHLIAKTTG